MSSTVIVLAVIVVFVVWAIAVYNGLITMRQRVNQAFADIDVQLKQRHDLVPNLVETVKGYMQHERQVLENVTAARASAVSAITVGQKAQADLLMTGALRGLFAVAENYPQLKANENFLKLQNRISELEERIADRREFFNDDVNTYNTRIRQIPDVFLANFMALKPREMFKVSDEDRRQVEVKLTEQKSAGV
jgi:LemA protein